ncbi:hypothetical protein BC832DRAFT_316682 [Gaertneriomyces semiglobifer]|nr:hypothetical protein BC832DRAFT_316682 [Gaertneriomyces semiglobifer]
MNSKPCDSRRRDSWRQTDGTAIENGALDIPRLFRGKVESTVGWVPAITLATTIQPSVCEWILSEQCLLQNLFNISANSADPLAYTTTFSASSSIRINRHAIRAPVHFGSVVNSRYPPRHHIIPALPPYKGVHFLSPTEADAKSAPSFFDLPD